MKNLKAYTLTEVLVVMTIMILLLALAFSSYSSFTETTKFNEDLSTLQHDILVIQRASMLLERSEEEDWIYGLGIDFGGINNHNGTYRFFKWCSLYPDFGSEETKSQYPSYIDGEDDGKIPTTVNGNESTCTDWATKEFDDLVSLTGYGYGSLNLKEDVVIDQDIQYLVFESVSGRAFLYDSGGNRIDSNVDLDIRFEKTYGNYKVLTVKNLTGRTKVSDYIQNE